MFVETINVNDLYQFYRYWLEIVCLKVNVIPTDGKIRYPSGRQHHILTSKQMDLLAMMMRNRKVLQMEKKIEEEDILDQLTTNDSGRQKIRMEMGLTSQRMYELLRNMEQNPSKIIIRRNFDNGKLDYYAINPKYMPELKSKNKFHVLMDMVIRFTNAPTV